MKPVVLVVFFVYFFISLVKIPLYNNDFWWHIGNGKYISENHSLPEEDPFTYTTGENSSRRMSVILKGYWLAQLLFYNVYDNWEAQGIIFLRTLILMLVLTFVFLTVRTQGTPLLISLILVAGVFFTAKQFAGERPQLFTFLGFSATYYLLEKFRINRSKMIWLVPFIVLVLANMHPGYIVCILLITLYLVGEGMENFLEKERKQKRLLAFFIITVSALVCSMFNPLGPLVLSRVFSFAGEQTRGVVEYMSTFKLYIDKMIPFDYAYVLFILLAFLSAIYWKKIGFAHMLVLFFFGAMSFVAIRFVIFFMLAATPIIARMIMYLKDEKLFRKSVSYFQKIEAVFTLMMFIAGVFLLFSSLPSLANQEFGEETRFSVPKGAADFLKEVSIKGNMFNEYGFGGYLIWRLYPEQKVFIDGRVPDVNVLHEYNAIASAGEYGQKTWEEWMKRYDISYVVMPPLRPNGDIYPLIEALFDREEWALIYHDHLSLIFLKRDGTNREIIESYEEKKNDGLNTVIIQASARSMQNNVNPRYLITLGKTFYRMKRYKDAQEAFRMASERAPGDMLIQEWLSRLEKVRE